MSLWSVGYSWVLLGNVWFMLGIAVLHIGPLWCGKTESLGRSLGRLETRDNRSEQWSRVEQTQKTQKRIKRPAPEDKRIPLRLLSPFQWFMVFLGTFVQQQENQCSLS